MPADERDARIEPGGRLVLGLPYGPARCRGERPEPGDATLVLTTGTGTRPVALELRPSDVLTGLHDAECEAAAVREVVDLGFADGWSAAGPRAAVGEIVLTARRDQRARVVAVGGNVIFGVGTDPPGAPLPAVAAEGETAGVRLRIAAERCDPHVLIEYKRTFHYPVRVRIGDDPPVTVDLEAEGPTRRVLQAALEACLG